MRHQVDTNRSLRIGRGECAIGRLIGQSDEVAQLLLHDLPHLKLLIHAEKTWRGGWRKREMPRLALKRVMSKTEAKRKTINAPAHSASTAIEARRTKQLRLKHLSSRNPSPPQSNG